MASSSPSPPGSWIPPFLSRYSNPAPSISSPSPSTSNAVSPAPRDPNAPAPNSIYTARGRKQASVFLAGVVSVVWAGSMTRRSLRKRRMPLPTAVLQEVAPATTTGQSPAVQAARQAGQQATAATASATAVSATAGTFTVAEGLHGTRKATGVMAETLQAYRGGIRQTSPGTSIGVGDAVAKPTSETLAHVSSPIGAAGATWAEDAATQAAAEELNASGPILAMEALFLATANVLAWALLVAGGALWYADISSVEELRRAVRGGLGVDGTGRSEQEAEEEMEEWLARVLKRGDERAGETKVDERGRVR